MTPCLQSVTKYLGHQIGVATAFGWMKLNCGKTAQIGCMIAFILNVIYPSMITVLKQLTIGPSPGFNRNYLTLP